MSLRVHALEGAMVSTEKGVSKLLTVYNQGAEDTQVFVLSPVRNPELSFDKLLSAAEDHEASLWTRLEKNHQVWTELVSSSISSNQMTTVQKEIDDSFTEIRDILKAVWILKDKAGAAPDHLEALTSKFLAKILSARFNDEGTSAMVYSPETVLEKDFAFPANLKVAFIAGSLIYCDNDRDASGREGEDEGWGEYTAALVAKKFHAPLTFWNQRSLFYSASHKDVPNAHIIRSMTYAEATELSFFGAPVVHPHSFIPAEEARVPLSLRYWGDISEPGTLITATDESDKKNPVKAFSVVKNISLINVEGSGMSGVPGVSSRLFTALRNERISVIFISQASSEYSICFAVPQSQAAKAKATLVSEFSDEIAAHQISSIETEQDLSILAVVGEGMPGEIGIAGKFFSSLARAGVNIRAIAQGSSERNISAVISSSDAVKAERALHSVFFMSEQTLSLGLFGPGNIGGTLLDQIGRESERLKREFDLDIRVRGIATSKKMLLSEDGIDLSSWREQLDKYGIAYNEAIFLNHIKASYYPHWVLVDSTASADRAMQYKSFLEQGFHVITPNKKASSGPYDYYTALFNTSKKTGKKFLYETTVGAGLPIIVTLKDLRETGDRIEKVEGMVSGTLAWLFSNYDGTVPFSEMVKKAMALGYTEPDPRDDLSGMDVGRKTVILARELGYRAEVADLAIENLVPEHLRSCSKEEFLERISEMDAHMLELYRDATAHGKKLRYVGTVNNGQLSVSLAQFPVDHPFSQAKGTDNVIEFTTERYHKQPLVVQGPGAGPEVTAAGIFADVLRLSAYLGSKI